VDSTIIHHGGSGGVPTIHMSPIEDDQGGHGARADGRRSINDQRSASMIADLRAENQHLRRSVESLERRLEVSEQDRVQADVGTLEILGRFRRDFEASWVARYNLLRDLSHIEDLYIEQRRRNRSLEEGMSALRQRVILLQGDKIALLAQLIAASQGGGVRQVVADQGPVSGNYELDGQDSTAASQDTVSPVGMRKNRRRSASCP